MIQFLKIAINVISYHQFEAISADSYTLFAVDLSSLWDKNKHLVGHCTTIFSYLNFTNLTMMVLP